WGWGRRPAAGSRAGGAAGGRPGSGGGDPAPFAEVRERPHSGQVLTVPGYHLQHRVQTLSTTAS
ncbi:MAG: hypothetical protein ACLQGJ_03625, partial [Candidatus Dormibacteria bacterium]